MNVHDGAPQPPEGRMPGRPGRRLGPIADSVGSAHRAWLEPLRAKFLSSGMTISDLHTRTGWAKSKISELLRGTGLYPRWEITQSLVRELRIPTWPMRRLWASAALEAQKKQDWIDRCIERPAAVSTSPDVPPIDLRAFKELQKEFYVSYADVFLCNSRLAKRVVSDTFDVLELRWNEALASSDVVRFAWFVLRSGVMARAPHVDGRPDLGAAAFDTVALERAMSDEEKFAQYEETSTLFKVLSRLPDQQLDVMVLRHLRGMPPSTVADVLGVPVASVRSDERHAMHVVEAVLCTESDPERNAL
ncbi:sigma-70 family RNA polymerase sigma factor [Streptomyces sp. NPDC093108]|uniref:sigma-70 family RNA polymerase sigma factor n=1 Tax=Streptomyces sp. NPDC093108 TaxID=3366030 RepID=UPI00382A6136